MSQMTHEEVNTLLAQAIRASEQGNYDKQKSLLQKLPLPAHLAKIAKDMWGKDFLKCSQWDLSEAEVLYGKNWLD